MSSIVISAEAIAPSNAVAPVAPLAASPAPTAAMPLGNGLLHRFAVGLDALERLPRFFNLYQSAVVTFVEADLPVLNMHLTVANRHICRFGGGRNGRFPLVKADRLDLRIANCVQLPQRAAG